MAHPSLPRQQQSIGSAPHASPEAAANSKQAEGIVSSPKWGPRARAPPHVSRGPNSRAVRAAVCRRTYLLNAPDQLVVVVLQGSALGHYVCALESADAGSSLSETGFAADAVSRRFIALAFSAFPRSLGPRLWQRRL